MVYVNRMNKRNNVKCKNPLQFFFFFSGYSVPFQTYRMIEHPRVHSKQLRHIYQVCLVKRTLLKI